MIRRTPILLTLLTILLSDAARGQDSPADDKLKRLIDRIAKGDELDAADASEQLVELLYGPLTRAIGSLEKVPGTGKDRPIPEQVRLRRAIGRLNAALRIRVCRLDLPEEDRKLFDKFVKEYPDLTANLFDDNYKVRRDALDSIPLDAGSGAGVMICARVDDEDADVAKAALEIAVKLKDPVVARGLTRYVKGATEAVKQGYLNDSKELLAALALIVHECLQVMAAMKPAEGAPVAVDAFRTFSRIPQWDAFHRAAAARALADFGDQRVAPILLETMNSVQEAEFRATQTGTPVIQTVGDAALLALLKLNDLKPEAFGFSTNEEWGKFAGFSDDKVRQDGYRRFRIWYEQKSAKPPETPASKPDGKD